MSQSKSIWVLAWLFTLGGVCIAQPQWEKLAEFNTQVTAVNFLAAPNDSVGFLGLRDGGVWKSTNRGISWRDVTPIGSSAYVTAFSFKDGLTGFFSSGMVFGTFYDQRGLCYKTTDGGDSWSPITTTRSYNATVYYHLPTQLVFVSRWRDERAIVSSNEGRSWQLYGAASMNGVAFLNDTDGVHSGLNSDYYVTSDGGRRWSPVGWAGAIHAWQPAAIPGTQEYYVVADGTADYYSSADIGRTWSRAGSLQGEVFSGEIISSSNGTLFAQTEKGVFSKETGSGVWNSIGGPLNEADTRLALSCNTLFAGELIREQTGERGALWKLDMDPPRYPELAVTANVAAVEIDSPLRVDIRLTDELGSAAPDKEIHVDLVYGEASEVGSIIPAQGWTVASAPGLRQNQVRLVLTRTTAGVIATDSIIASVMLRSFLTRENGTFVSIDTAWYATHTEQTVVCRTSPGQTRDTVRVAFLELCGDSTLRQFLRDAPLISGVSIVPNPSSLASEIHLQFELAESSIVKLQISDMGGSIHFVEWFDAEGGSVVRRLPAGLPLGAFKLTLESRGEVKNSKFIILAQ